MALKKIEWKKYTPLLLMLVFPVLGWMYALTNNIDNQEVYRLTTSVDEAIPFIKYFSLPYSIWIFYIYVCLFYFFKKDINVYYRSLMTYVVCALLCYLIYSVFQTTVDRPMIVGSDPFSELMRYIYNRDQPFNCFPSIHCFSSYMVMRAIWTSNFRNKWNVTLITGMSSIIIMSTLFVKQHVIMDALAGFFLVEVVTAVIILFERRLRVTRERQKSTFGA
ncbi:phosphatase PAP2 family protein [Cohnella cholangitidis]|uniref:Phosphatase PAP2 family protein n=1 Tax=Cohnella cholangitidis TaxID=2598458 RepID=A0A7G5C137_9BACL|nr:phosphatase PAP2 family protein [Cohnella cholangitidis]QMV42921.1 phosphatase PAP2 family protein [Cohnella cholangitidis]